MLKKDEISKILVTGGSGFIGTNLVESLSAKYAHVLNVDPDSPMDPAHRPFWKRGDIMAPAALTAGFQEYKPTHVIHLAARAECDENTTVEAGYKVNTAGTQNVLDAIKACGSVQRLIMTSTQFVFNKGAALPQGDLDYAPVTVYGQSKIITEQLTRKAGLTCTWTIIRPTNVWGPWHIRHTQQFFRILRKGLYLHPGRDEVMRSYAFVGNVIDQMERILEVDRAKVDGKTFYVGDAALNLFDWVDGFSQSLTGRRVRVVPRPVLKLIAVGGDLVQAVTRKPFFINSSRLVSMTAPYLTPMDETFKALGPCRYSLEEGIALTTEWLRRFEASGVVISGKRSLTS